jgi:branched-chain amino acid transport system substrate-binding protein
VRSKYKPKLKGFLLVAVFLLGTLILSGCVGQEEEVVGGHPLDGVEVEIGFLHANPNTMQGERVAADLGFADTAAYFQTLGIDFTMTPLYENCEESAVKAAEKFETLVARGVKFVLGFRWSSHAKACLEKANEQKVLMLSDASTSPLLMIPDDYLFRMPTTDIPQGPAIATVLTEYSNYEAAVCIQRADTWADGLYQTTEERYLELGGTITERIRYDPAKTEFAAEADLLNSAVEDAIAEYGKDKVCVLYLGFDSDGVGLLAASEGYDTLMSVTWVGSDGHVRSTRMQDELPEALVKTRHPSTYMGVVESEIYWNMAERYNAEMGYYPGTYDVLAYDSVWLLAKCFLETASINSEKCKEALPTVGLHHFGASGWCQFNEDGDRKAAVYNIWAVLRPEESEHPEALHPDPNEIGWERIGQYDPVSDSVTWFVDVPLSLG